MGHLTSKTSTSTNDNNQINGVKVTPRFSNKVRHIARLTAEVSFMFLVSYSLIWGLFFTGYVTGQKDASRDVLIASNETSYTQPVDSTNVASKLPKCETL